MIQKHFSKQFFKNLTKSLRYFQSQNNYTPWDSKTQSFHGGQQHRYLEKYVEDFSVTTNCLGTPRRALQEATQIMPDICHYPASDFEPAISDLAQFMFNDPKMKNHMLLGNGASELIDIVSRWSRDKQMKLGNELIFNSGSSTIQYQEYQRAATVVGFTPDDQKKKALTAIVNPTNPTGEYLNFEQLRDWIYHNVKTGDVIIDDSMQTWRGPNWKEDSLLSHEGRQFIKNMLEERNVAIWMITSWTKIWGCPGLRIGSLVAPNQKLRDEVKKMQVPWSVNTPALHFLSSAAKDKQFLEETWEITPMWNMYMREKLKRFNWTIHGETWMSWMWVDMKNEKVAEKAVDLAAQAGVPIRWGKQGYNMPTFVRLAVRDPEYADVLLNALNKCQYEEKVFESFASAI